ncbi:MAG: maleylpyruvate isomerase family mycothiol-dependent enzyme [Mycobacteriaceae bacterium]|nr:maleylpyruvate isomerase family mycothiol-dependent enzyme [Mycobacteriaceae bacterium]
MGALEMARAEREDFAALLDELSDDQWQAPTLCERWRVRDVVAHAFGYDELGRAALVRQFIKGRFDVDRINELGVTELADRTPDQLRAMVGRHLQPRGLTAGFGGRIALTDNMIHQQDIRRKLGMPRHIPAERLRAALDFALYAPTIRGAWRARGVRLVADDLDWSHGRGPMARGGGEALLLTMAGRRAALDDLSGPGTATLAQHLPARGR